MIRRERELSVKEIEVAIGQHVDEAGLQAYLGTMELRNQPVGYRHEEITNHIRAISILRRPSFERNSINDAANATNRLHRYRTPSGINAAVIWFLEGERYGTQVNEHEWQTRKLRDNLVALDQLGRLTGKVIGPLEALELISTVLDDPRKTPVDYKSLPHLILK